MIDKIQKFFKDNLGSEAFTRCRKREVVLQRKLIIIFLIKEIGLKECQVAKIMNLHHSAIFYHLKEVIDLEFDRFYIPRARALKEKFDFEFPDYGLR
ncbi:hypothetical protein EGI16_03590 [Chryseobacterium sp. G0240]|uniref:hypothetical protein n=1 Tax=Chryseobacterium sp. G0240 TaxID=2487066 RepID=UPI000F45796D|nr:hypothetical protein [Chryseobacterium sp. G0240]ROI05482.1 hypothetical protein EGI16_03590 [Chryseobacterium sp. G0240]